MDCIAVADHPALLRGDARPRPHNDLGRREVRDGMLAIRRISAGSGAGTDPRRKCGGNSTRTSSNLENDHIGQYKGANAIRAAIDAAPCAIAIGDQADEILGRPAFPFTRTKFDVDLVVVSMAELGFDLDGASLRDIYARANTFGLELCPPEVGPILRLNYLDQPLGEFLHIAMRPVATYDGELVDFTLGNGGGALLLIGGDAHPDVVLTGGVRFVFVHPRIDTVVGGLVPNSGNALVKR